MSHDDIEASKAPLIEHLIELRSRLVKALIAIAIAFVACFIVADTIFNILLVPYERAVGQIADLELIYTAPQEYFFTQMKLALFGALFLAFPVIAVQVYMFVAPGLYRHERQAFMPYLIATPILFAIGTALVYFVVMPLAMTFFLSLEQQGGPGQASIELLPKVNEYLSLIM
ncbi:MAG: preprotein translocase subunit TatC, partial [Hyphomicrobiales bacterium]|nr:preprotein translocase subunit TatC [Hyphomicrobiales bacterium]